MAECAAPALATRRHTCFSSGALPVACRSTAPSCRGTGHGVPEIGPGHGARSVAVPAAGCLLAPRTCGRASAGSHLVAPTLRHPRSAAEYDEHARREKGQRNHHCRSRHL